MSDFLKRRIQERDGQRRGTQETSAPVIDIRGAFLEQRRLGDFICEDGMHPNERGQHLIHTVISDFAEQKKDLFLPA